VFMRYCVRNAILPQVTALALALGQILSGAVLVEVIFGYPGIGTLLYQAIRENDHFDIQGIVFTVIVALGFTTVVLDVIYPWLDLRISYRCGTSTAAQRLWIVDGRWIGAGQLGASPLGREHPVDPGAFGVALMLPSSDLGDEMVTIWDAPIQALAA
jgi:hypothetical protein